MAPDHYLLRVLSKPNSNVDEATWQKWYIDEHIPDVVGSGTTTRGALFRASNDFTLQTKTPTSSNKSDLHNVQLSHFNESPEDKTFLAVYQTQFEKPLESKKFDAIRTTSDLLPGKVTQPNAEWDIRVYKLIQNYDPDNLGDGRLRFLCHIRCDDGDSDPK